MCPPVRLSRLPLNALRAFEASARHLSFTRAGLELRVTQAAVSQQVKRLEASLGASLFRRLPRGLALTDEGEVLLPSIECAFRGISDTLERFRDGRFTEVLTVGVVGTFATGWLLPRCHALRLCIRASTCACIRTTTVSTLRARDSTVPSASGTEHSTRPMPSGCSTHR